VEYCRRLWQRCRQSDPESIESDLGMGGELEISNSLASRLLPDGTPREMLTFVESYRHSDPEGMNDTSKGSKARQEEGA
jgi:hypothetical protein